MILVSSPALRHRIVIARICAPGAFHDRDQHASHPPPRGDLDDLIDPARARAAPPMRVPIFM